MVSFQCDGCADTVKKPQLDKHRQRCWAPFTCLDCSTTFHNGEYKSHTSCISEAEKYQGALYRGPRKGQGQSGNNSAIQSDAPTPAASTPAAESPAPSEGAGANGIHPSRLNALAQPEREPYAGRGGRGGRGGFQRGGGFQQGRGGFQRGGFQQAAPAPGVPPNRKSVTGENRTAPEGGMRTWGSAAPSDAGDAPSPAPAGHEEGEKKKSKYKKKGDKGGTGAKANSRIIAEAAEAAAAAAKGEEPAAKKRKRDDEAPAAAATEAAPAEASEKTMKRIKKHMSKLEDKVSGGVSLQEWLGKVGTNKDKTIAQGDILAGVRVAFKDGAWTLSL